MLIEPTSSLGASFESTLTVLPPSRSDLMVYAGVGVFLETRADEFWRRAVPCETDRGLPHNWLIPSTVVALLAFAPLGVAARALARQPLGAYVQRLDACCVDAQRAHAESQLERPGTR